MKIAILGAGFCGLASAYYLTEYVKKGIPVEIHIFDPGEIGHNASGMAAGLLHPFPGAFAKEALHAREGLQATLKLAEAASDALKQPVAFQTGLLRAALTHEQEFHFRKCGEMYADVKWRSKRECQRLFPGMTLAPGIFINSAYLVKTKLYLEGLWRLCELGGVKWIKRKAHSLKEFQDEYQAVIVAAGFGTMSIQQLAHLPLRPVKGQLLDLLWPSHLPPLKTPINSKAYLVPAEEPSTCIVGATFEKNVYDEAPNREEALRYLLPKMREIFPSIECRHVLSCRAGMRATTPTHRPIARRESSTVWVITGMGSKGLLYHARFSKQVVDDVISTLFNKLLSIKHQR